MTSEKLKAMDEIAGEWKIVSEATQIKAFQRILGVLNRYYSDFGKKSESLTFRELVEKSNTDDVEIQIKKFGGYEYLIKATVGTLSDSWIHLDGIGEEREIHTSTNNLGHPVFSIVCLGDIYNNCK